MILKLKRTPGLYLVGFMGSGKTTVGRMVADELGWSFDDIDEEIEAVQRMSIAQIFRERGEPEFRRIESAILAERVQLVRRGKPTVIALGGGAFAQKENFELLEENGVSVWLECSFDVVRRRVGIDPTRPLSRDPDAMEELFELRREAYARADFKVDASPDATTVCRTVLKLPIF
jgi:shikimate kinase